MGNWRLRGQVGRHAGARRRQPLPVRLHSRTGRDITAALPGARGPRRRAAGRAARRRDRRSGSGLPCFEALAERVHVTDRGRRWSWRRRPVSFMVFDVLRFGGRRADPTGPGPTGAPRWSASNWPTAGALTDLHRRPGAARGHLDARLGGRRRQAARRPLPARHAAAPGWVKATHRRLQACVVGGWRPENVGTARVNASRVGALLLGVPDEGGLRYAGRVGSGLASDVAQRALRGRLLDAERSPFLDRLPRPEEKGARWCLPEVVVEVSHMGWTDVGKLRQPVYRGRPGRSLRRGRPPRVLTGARVRMGRPINVRGGV